MSVPSFTQPPLEGFLKQTGRVASLQELQVLVDDFENIAQSRWSAGLP
jgi:hypothetical protein